MNTPTTQSLESLSVSPRREDAAADNEYGHGCKTIPSCIVMHKLKNYSKIPAVSRRWPAGAQADDVLYIRKHP
jgi:hypothetical protein